MALALMFHRADVDVFMGEITLAQYNQWIAYFEITKADDEDGGRWDGINEQLHGDDGAPPINPNIMDNL